MTARSLPFSFRNILDRVGVAPTQQRGHRWQRVIAALEDWWTTSYLAWRSEIAPGDYGERLRRFCRDCGEETPHKCFDEFGVGWYAQIFHCRYCGDQGMRIWPLG
jgi:hypothetical protein